MTELLKVIFLGIVEGITEWLPISSTGHMILVNEFVHLNVSQDFWDVFLYVIQLGAILAVVVLFWKKIWPFQTAKGASESGEVRDRWPVWMKPNKIVMWLKIAVSCLPAVVIALPLDNWIEAHFNKWYVVALMLIIYGVLFIVIENYNKHRRPEVKSVDAISWKMALLIGVFQVLSLIPGTSRSGATIIGGILLGASRKVAAEYTFFLAIPVMFGMSLLKIMKFGLHFTGTEILFLIVGMLVAFIISVITIRFLMGYIKRHDFKVFGWYRIVLGVIVFLFFGIRAAFGM